MVLLGAVMGQCGAMHPKALLDSCADLLKHVLKFDQPADMMLSKYFREFRLGPRERATLAETVYAVLRKKNLYTYLAQHGHGAPERRLAILGFTAGPPQGKKAPSGGSAVLVVTSVGAIIRGDMGG